MENTILVIETIISNPAIRSGRPVIAGTTLRVQDVAESLRFSGYTPEEIGQHYQLTLAQVHAALAYYFDHQAAIDQQIEADIALIRQAQEQGFGQQPPMIFA